MTACLRARSCREAPRIWLISLGVHLFRGRSPSTPYGHVVPKWPERWALGSAEPVFDAPRRRDRTCADDLGAGLTVLHGAREADGRLHEAPAMSSMTRTWPAVPPIGGSTFHDRGAATGTPRAPDVGAPWAAGCRPAARAGPVDRVVASRVPPPVESFENATTSGRGGPFVVGRADTWRGHRDARAGVGARQVCVRSMPAPRARHVVRKVCHGRLRSRCVPHGAPPRRPVGRCFRLGHSVLASRYEFPVNLGPRAEVVAPSGEPVRPRRGRTDARRGRPGHKAARPGPRCGPAGPEPPALRLGACAAPARRCWSP